MTSKSAPKLCLDCSRMGAIFISRRIKIETKKKFHHRMLELLEAYTCTRGCWTFSIWTLNRNTSIYFYLQSIDCSFKRVTILCWRFENTWHHYTWKFMRIIVLLLFIYITIPCQIFIYLTNQTISRWLRGFVPHLETK